MHNLGLAYLMSNDHFKALQYFERAVKTRKGSLGMDHPEVGKSLDAISRMMLKILSSYYLTPLQHSYFSIQGRHDPSSNEEFRLITPFFS